MANKVVLQLDVDGEGKVTGVLNATLIKIKDVDRAGEESARRTARNAKIYEDSVKRMNDRFTLGKEFDPTGSSAQSIRAITAAQKDAAGTSKQLAQETRNLTGAYSSNTLAIIGGTTAVLAFGATSIRASTRASDANRVLKASALEAGIAYQTATAQAEAFAQRAALSEGQANRTYASIIQFAKAAQATDKLDLFTKRFTDLAAARGVQAAELGDVARQLQALTDEATDKLLGANPSAFYADYAKSLNKTAESLTDAEKRAAILDAVIRRGALFDGEAEKRLGDASGKVDTLTAKFENLKVSVGNGLSGPLAALLDVVNAVGDSASNRGIFKVTDGKGAAQLDKEADERAKLIAEQLRDQEKKIAEAVRQPFSSLDAFALSKAAPRISIFDTDPAKREQIITEAKKEAEKFRDDLKTRLEETARDPKSSISLLRFALKELNGAGGVLERDDRLRLQQQIEQAIEAQIKQGLDRIKSLKTTTDDLLSSLSQKRAGDNPFVAIFSEAEVAARKLEETTRGLSASVISEFKKIQDESTRSRFFDAQLDAGSRAIDLRREAQDLRRGGASPPPSARQQFSFEQIRRGVATSPNLHLDLAGYFAEKPQAQGSTVDRLREQIAFVEKLRAQNADLSTSASSADKRIIALSAGVKPEDLTPELQEKAAGAREREASRLENADKEAATQRTETLNLQRKIAAELEALRKQVQSGIKLDGEPAQLDLTVNDDGSLSLLGRSPRAGDYNGQQGQRRPGDVL